MSAATPPLAPPTAAMRTCVRAGRLQAGLHTQGHTGRPRGREQQCRQPPPATAPSLAPHQFAGCPLCSPLASCAAAAWGPPPVLQGACAQSRRGTGLEGEGDIERARQRRRVRESKLGRCIWPEHPTSASSCSLIVQPHRAASRRPGRQPGPATLRAGRAGARRYIVTKFRNARRRCTTAGGCGREANTRSASLHHSHALALLPRSAHHPPTAAPEHAPVLPANGSP